MNERIRELADQCWEEEYYDEYLGRNEPLFRYNKFAEMILMECLTICEELGDKGMDGHYCADKIKQHFGVEL